MSRSRPLAAPAPVVARSSPAWPPRACVRDEGGGAADDGGAGRRRATARSCPTARSTRSRRPTAPVEVELWHAPRRRVREQPERRSPRSSTTSQDKVQVEVRNQGVSLRRGAPQVRRRPSRAGSCPPSSTSRTPRCGSWSTAARSCPPRRASRPTTSPPASSRRCATTTRPTTSSGRATRTSASRSSTTTSTTSSGPASTPSDPPQTLDELRTTAEALKEAGIEAPLALILNAWFVESLDQRRRRHAWSTRTTAATAWPTSPPSTTRSPTSSTRGSRRWPTTACSRPLGHRRPDQPVPRGGPAELVDDHRDLDRRHHHQGGARRRRRRRRRVDAGERRPRRDRPGRPARSPASRSRPRSGCRAARSS